MCCIILFRRPLPSVVQRPTRPIRLPLLAVLYLPLPTPLVTVVEWTLDTPLHTHLPRRIGRLESRVQRSPSVFPKFDHCSRGYPIREAMPISYGPLLWKVHLWRQDFCSVWAAWGSKEHRGKGQVATGCFWYLGTCMWGQLGDRAEGIGCSCPCVAHGKSGYESIISS